MNERGLEAEKKTPMVDWAHRTLHHPHVFILGAGASRAACLNGDANGRVLPLMNDLVETLQLSDFLRQHGFDPGTNFEATYAAMYERADTAGVRTELEHRIRDYFSGLVLPQTPTLYDYLLLGLRAKDIIATFNWDPLLFQAYKRNLDVGVGSLPTWAILHGNVAIGTCHTDRRKGFLELRCDTCRSPFQPVPLLFPITKKDYTSDPLIRGEWDATAHHLQYGYLLTIFGYRAPDSDAAAIDLLRSPWLQNKWREFAEIEIVDIREREEVERTWKEFFVRNHYGIFTDWRHLESLRFPRRSCEAFFAASMQNDPWHENPIPMGMDLPELHRWLRPLLEEEERATRDGGSLSSNGRG